MEKSHTQEHELSLVELSWVNTLIDYTDLTTVSASSFKTPEVSTKLSKVQKAERRKIINRKSAYEARIRQKLYLQSLENKVQELEQQRQTLLVQIQMYTEENKLLQQSTFNTHSKNE
jgi:hypothetical protein